MFYCSRVYKIVNIFLYPRKMLPHFWWLKYLKSLLKISIIHFCPWHYCYPSETLVSGTNYLALSCLGNLQSSNSLKLVESFCKSAFFTGHVDKINVVNDTTMVVFEKFEMGSQICAY